MKQKKHWFQVVTGDRGFGDRNSQFSTTERTSGVYMVDPEFVDKYTFVIPEDIASGAVAYILGPNEPTLPPSPIQAFVSAGESRTGRIPLDAKARKETPLFTFLNEYFPDVFVALAQLSFKANEKHNPGMPMHWSREKSSDHKDCAIRHLMDEERIDPETGQPEAVAAAWRACANAQLVIEKLRADGRL